MYDIVIIGGGIAGLNTYFQLLQKHKQEKILLLERNNYFGGRILQIQENINNTEYSFPAGAARFNKNHKEVIKLLKQFELLDFRKDRPFSADIDFIDTEQQFSNKFNRKNGYEFINKVIKLSSTIHEQVLKQMSFSELAKKLLPKDEAEFLTYASGYTGQIKNMNSYDAIHLFKKGIRIDIPYWGGKYHTLIHHMVIFLKKHSGELLLNANVKNIKKNKDIYEIYYNTTKILTNKIIFCIPQQSLLQFSILKPIHCVLKESVTCKPLCRTYAIFDKNTDWIKQINKKIVTNNQLRYIIPIDPENGLIMISYTDDVYTKHWKNMQNNQKKLKNEVVKLVNKTFDINITPPNKVIVCHWDCGVAYWNKNIDSSAVSKFLINPLPDLYISGENFSLNQSWVEGALQTSNEVIKLLS